MTHRGCHGDGAEEPAASAGLVGADVAPLPSRRRLPRKEGPVLRREAKLQGVWKRSRKRTEEETCLSQSRGPDQDVESEGTLY